ncbi:hypothetical protein TNCV_1524901 [Trichonephila clavipes]|nr:hypothetical protein TNCV_1524901 [Trichonephila clavipes]
MKEKLIIGRTHKLLPCCLRFGWPEPANAESGRGNRLGRSEWTSDPRHGDLGIKNIPRFSTEQGSEKGEFK